MKEMNRLISYTAALAVLFLGTSCVKEKLEQTYTNQESKIDAYIESNRYTNSDKTESLRVVYNGGSTRLVRVEGVGDELKAHGTVAIYYAGYVFTSGKNKSSLFITNHEDTAKEAGWTLTDENFELLQINMAETELVEGLRHGLMGVKSGERCEILFSGKYGFGNTIIGIIPANSALLYEIWVEAVSND
jgi:FKBP-type peptidyl-prolyl cis-trans isomerase